MTSDTTNTANVDNWPWIQPVWERTASDLDTLHHGLLVSGVEGIAKREFAIALSQTLLCDNAGNAGRPCGDCQNCTLFTAGTHPDFHVLTTELEWRDGRSELISAYCNRYQDVAAREKRTNPSRVIPVDHVRLLIERFYSHSHISKRKVALIVPADCMNVNAANALLKLLEEPPDNSILILVSEFPGYLPATIRSRCVQIGIPLPTHEHATTWLQQSMSAKEAAQVLALSHGSPLVARKMFEDEFLALQTEFVQGITELLNGKTSGVDLVVRFKKHDFLQWLNWLHRFSCELIRWSCGAAVSSWCAKIEINATHIQSEKLFLLYDKIGYYRKIAREQLNEQLAMEELILGLQRVVRK